MSGTPNDKSVRVHVWVMGRVQGVGFRAFVFRTAKLGQITGWVRNVGWDKVEVVAEGEKEIIDRFVEEVKRGPTSSRIDETRVEWETPTGDFKDFDVRSSF